MDQFDIDEILDRKYIAASLINKIRAFFVKRDDSSIKRGFYVYGAPGSGKTEFVMRTLQKAGFDVVKYDAGDIRNKNVVDSITRHQMADVNIMSLWKRENKKIVIVMDEIDGMNNGDKGGINALIKLIRPKKTKKQKLESNNYNPIICINNYHIDKKISDLMRVCETFEIKTPTNFQMIGLVKHLLPISSNKLQENIVNLVQGDLRRLSHITHIVEKGLTLDENTFDELFSVKSLNSDAKQTVKTLLNTKCDINEHNTLMNETDRTIVGLLWHENVIDVLKKQNKQKSILAYHKILESLCLGDYIDRITFQKQIWQFNEMSSLIKTIQGNHIYHDSFVKCPAYNPSEVRFTKVLTKYSTEFNNFTFLQSICQKLGMDRKDMFLFFTNARDKKVNEIEFNGSLSVYDISRLEIERIYRLIDRDLQNEESSVLSNEIVSAI